jgi:phage portal protein BeeE
VSVVDRLKTWLSGDRKAAPPQLARTTVLWPGDDPVERRLDPRQAAREGYEASTTVFACVTLIARAVAGLSGLWLLNESSGRGPRREIEEHALLQLLARPNRDTSGAEFLEDVVSRLLIGGSAYIYLAESTPIQPPRELWSLAPQDVKIEHDGRGQLSGFVYQPQDAAQRASRRGA